MSPDFMHAMQGLSHFTNDPMHSLQIDCLDNGNKKTQSKIICPLKFFDCPNRVAPYVLPHTTYICFFPCPGCIACPLLEEIYMHELKYMIGQVLQVTTESPSHQLPPISYLATKESLSLFLGGGQ